MVCSSGVRAASSGRQATGRLARFPMNGRACSIPQYETSNLGLISTMSAMPDEASSKGRVGRPGLTLSTRRDAAGKPHHTGTGAARPSEPSRPLTDSRKGIATRSHAQRGNAVPDAPRPLPSVLRHDRRRRASKAAFPRGAPGITHIFFFSEIETASVVCSPGGATVGSPGCNPGDSGWKGDRRPLTRGGRPPFQGSFFL